MQPSCGVVVIVGAQVQPVIQQRIQKYSQSEIRFNLMAVVRNRKEALQEELASLEERQGALQAQLQALGSAMDMDEDSPGAHDREALEGQLGELLQQRASLQGQCSHRHLVLRP